MRFRRLCELRAEKGLTLKQVGDYLGISEHAYSLYETGKRDIPLPHLVTLADYYKVSTDYLLGREKS